MPEVHVATAQEMWEARASLRPRWVGFASIDADYRVLIQVAGPQPGPEWAMAEPPEWLPPETPFPSSTMWWLLPVPYYSGEVPPEQRSAVREIAWLRMTELGLRGQVALYRGWAALGPNLEDGVWLVVG
jgi:hypothetical protein